MKKNIFDIFVIGSIFFLVISALHFWRSRVLHSQGYLLFSIGTVLLSLTIMLFKYNSSLYVAFLVVGFIVVQIGEVILRTKEKYIRESYRKLPFLKRRLVGFYPLWAVQESPKIVDEVGMKSKKGLDTQTMLPGLFLVCVGISLFFWRNEFVYPAFLAGTGILLIIAGKLYSKRIQKKRR
jgi:hypothetical protein